LLTTAIGSERPIPAGRDWPLYDDEYGRMKFGNCQNQSINTSSLWTDECSITINQRETEAKLLMSGSRQGIIQSFLLKHDS
jgi:hypothetical protein